MGGLSKALYTLSNNDMLNASFVDVFAMDTPRTIVETKNRGKQAGIEMGLREYTGTFIAEFSAAIFAIIASKIIAQVSEIGGVLLNNISYDIYDKAPFYKEARKLAMEKAYQKASDLAEYGNVKLGDPISIVENRSYDYAVSTANYAMAKMAYDTEEEADM
jgi:hypothetical protein